MKDQEALRRRALALMAETLMLLDEAGEDLAAAHQQAAHDVLAPMVPPDRRDGLEPPDLGSDPALVRAMGAVLALFATLMQRGDITPLDEIARTLGIYAVASAETSPQEGLILGCWGAMLRDAAEVGGSV